MIAYTLSALALLATSAKAAGVVNNAAVASQIQSAASSLNGDGTYVFKNKATGQTLSFVRQGGLTNFFPQDNAGSLDVQFNGQGQARLSGGNNKCVSAQWSFEEFNDLYAVPYACTVGSGLLTGSATLEKTKQWWYLLPADGGSAPAPAANDDSADDSNVLAAAAPAKNAQVNAAAAPVQQQGKGNVRTKQAPAAAATPQSGKYPPGVDPKDRTTWICKHDGTWLLRHPGYVTKAGHVECADELAAARAAASKAKVKRHRGGARMNEKRGGQQAYYIIAVDHILDMVTRAIGSDPITSFGGYTSTTLPVWDKTDASQQWYITSA